MNWIDSGGFLALYYFAYGSNMNWQQMRRRCPSARFICVARLPDYQFGITRHSHLRDCGTANVYPAPDNEVWGIIYDVCDTDLTILDGFEDGYRRETLSFFPRDDGEQPVTALVYLAEIEDNVPLPNAVYRRLIVEGAKHWELPPAYVNLLEAIQVAVVR
jgi:gamma-glutamylcyclotransferase